jgi:hypothetical protein
MRTRRSITGSRSLHSPRVFAGLALPAQAILVPVGDPQAYSIVQFYAESGTATYITPNPVSARGDIGLIEAKTQGGVTAGTALTSGFGLYGATAFWPGNGRHENGTRIDGAATSLIFDQRYRAVGEHSLVHLSLFGMRLEVLDPDGQDFRNYFARFQLMVSLLPDPPAAPSFSDVANFDFNPPASQYALRMSATASGHDGNFDSHVDCTYCLRAAPVPKVTKSSIGLRLDIADMSFELADAIPLDTEYTVRTYLRVDAFGPRGEGFANAQFFDPQRGFGGGLEQRPVPESPVLILVGVGLLGIAVARRHRLRMPAN